MAPREEQTPPKRIGNDTSVDSTELRAKSPWLGRVWIRGFLIMPAAFLILTFLLTPLATLSAPAELRYGCYFKDPSSFNYLPLSVPQAFQMVLAYVLIVAAWPIVTYAFIRRRAIAPGLMGVYFSGILILMVWGYFFDLLAWQDSQLLLGSVGGYPLVFVYAAIVMTFPLIPYLAFSKRVKKTFVCHPGGVSPRTDERQGLVRLWMGLGGAVAGLILALIMWRWFCGVMVAASPGYWQNTGRLNEYHYLPVTGGQMFDGLWAPLLTCEIVGSIVLYSMLTAGAMRLAENRRGPTRLPIVFLLMFLFFVAGDFASSRVIYPCPPLALVLTVGLCGVGLPLVLRARRRGVA